MLISYDTEIIYLRWLVIKNKYIIEYSFMRAWTLYISWEKVDNRYQCYFQTFPSQVYKICMFYRGYQRARWYKTLTMAVSPWCGHGVQQMYVSTIQTDQLIDVACYRDSYQSGWSKRYVLLTICTRVVDDSPSCESDYLLYGFFKIPKCFTYIL